MASLRDPGPVEFEAVLQSTASSGAACFVDFPHDLQALYGKGNLVPVKVTWDGRVEYRGSLAKMGGACAMVLCRKDVVARLEKRAGEQVHVRVELDLAPRPVDVPAPLADALAGDAAAAAAWHALAPSCQREYAVWIGGAKQADTAARRVAQALPRILDGRRLK